MLRCAVKPSAMRLRTNHHPRHLDVLTHNTRDNIQLFLGFNFTRSITTSPRPQYQYMFRQLETSVDFLDHQGINLGYRGFIARRLRRTTSFHTLYTRSLSKLIITELKLKAASHSGTSADPILFTIYLFHGRSSLECRHPHYHVPFLAFFSADNQHVKTRSTSLLRHKQVTTIQPYAPSFSLRSNCILDLFRILANLTCHS